MLSAQLRNKGILLFAIIGIISCAIDIITLPFPIPELPPGSPLSAATMIPLPPEVPFEVCISSRVTTRFSGECDFDATVRKKGGGKHVFPAILINPGGRSAVTIYRLWPEDKHHQGSLIFTNGIQSCLLRDIFLQRADGTRCSLEKLVSGKRSILAFLEIGAEPTEHVLNEVLALEKSAKGNSKGIGCQLLFVLRQEKDLQHKTLQEVLALDAGSEIEILYDISGGASDANAALHTATGDTASGTLCGWQETAKRMRLAEKLPVLAAVRPDGTGIYGSCGYHVGSVELMVRILKEAVRTEAD